MSLSALNKSIMRVRLVLPLCVKYCSGLIKMMIYCTKETMGIMGSRLPLMLRLERSSVDSLLQCVKFKSDNVPTIVDTFLKVNVSLPVLLMGSK